ncbi:MAG: NAD-dependent epimerase/dehydratase family protein [Spirochaetales bacterium]
MMLNKERKIIEVLNKKVLVVGGTGLLGSRAIDHLVSKGYEVTTISLPSDGPQEDLYDGKVEYILKDINNLTDTEMLKIMRDKQYLLIAIGADERYAPKIPALTFYRKYNVQVTTNLLRMARLSKIKNVVILGSYFTYFNRVWPDLKLKETHPYIRSRCEQMEIAFTYNSNVMKVTVLELPYIFGTLNHHTPLWNMITEQLNSNKHIYYPLGGTAMATANEVAEAVEGAFLYADGGKPYQVASVNLKWKDFLSYLLKIQNQEHKVLTPYSNLATTREMKKKMKDFKKEGRESGLDLVKYLEFQKRDAYIDPSECMSNLKYNPDDIYAAINETLKACETQLLKETKKKK